MVVDDQRRPEAARSQRARGDGSHWDARFLNKLCLCLAKMSEGDRQLLLGFAEKVPHRRKKSEKLN